MTTDDPAKPAPEILVLQKALPLLLKTKPVKGVWGWWTHWCDCIYFRHRERKGDRDHRLYLLLWSIHSVGRISTYSWSHVVGGVGVWACFDPQ